MAGPEAQLAPGRVPAVAWQPGAIASGTETDQLAVTMDVWPTLAEMAGVPEPDERPLDGVSLVPVLTGGTLERGPMFWSFMDGLAMRDGIWKLVAGEDGIETPMLFDLSSDVGEVHDLARGETDRAERMAAQAEEWLRSVNADPTPQPSMSR